MSSIHIFDDESETSTQRNTLSQRKFEKDPPKVIGWPFFPQQPIKSTNPLFFLGSAIGNSSHAKFTRNSCQAPVFPAAFQPSCWGGAAILAKPKISGKKPGGKVPYAGGTNQPKWRGNITIFSTQEMQVKFKHPMIFAVR